MSKHPLRFVVLHHTVPPAQGASHFDLMFEQSNSPLLATLRSPRWPITEPTELSRIADHRAAYLEYEGEIAGGRGSVKRLAAGTWSMVGNELHFDLLAGRISIACETDPIRAAAGSDIRVAPL